MSKGQYGLLLTILLIGLVFTVFFSPLRTYVFGFFLDTPTLNVNDKNSFVSKELFEVTFTDTEGDDKKIVPGQRKMFVNFWATWCGPCVAEFPSIQKAYEKFGKQVDFYLISLDDNEIKAKQFLKDNGYTAPVYFPNEALPPSVKPKLLPETLILSPNGKVLLRHVGAAQWDSPELDRYFTN